MQKRHRGIVQGAMARSRCSHLEHIVGWGVRVGNVVQRRRGYANGNRVNVVPKGRESSLGRGQRNRVRRATISNDQGYRARAAKPVWRCANRVDSVERRADVGSGPDDLRDLIECGEHCSASRVRVVPKVDSRRLAERDGCNLQLFSRASVSNDMM